MSLPTRAPGSRLPHATPPRSAASTIGARPAAPSPAAGQRATVAGARQPQIGPRRPAPVPARPRHLRVVRARPVPGRRPLASTVVTAALATAAALFGLVTVQSLVNQTQIRRTEIAERVEAKRDVLEALEVEVAGMSGLDRVAARAGVLGLVVPQVVGFLPAPDATAVPPALAAAIIPLYTQPEASPSAAAKPSASAKPRASAKPSTKPSSRPSANSSPAPSGGGR